MVAQAADRVADRDVVLARTRRRGAVAAVAALLFTTYVGLSALGFFPYLEAPAGIISLVLLPILVVAVQATISEYRTPDAGRSANPAIGRLLIGLAFLAALPTAFLSYFFEVAAIEPADCALLPPPGRQTSKDIEFLRHCDEVSPAETAGLVVWAAIALVTVLLLVAGMVLARRSRTVGWVALPLVGGGSLLAFDLGHATATLLRSVHP